jgi:hypothetical protein
MYSTEYNLMSTGAWVRNLAPTLLIITVVLMSLGYIIYFFKKGKSYKNTVDYLETSSPSKPLNSLKALNPFSKEDKSLTNSEQRNYISALDRLI